MSVGDLKNNLRKLQAGLRGIKYEKDLDLDSLSKGAVASYLPIYHYLFLDYSIPIAENISNLNIELSGKTDLRFVEAMYKVLRELFAYKPPITKDQFFANGFVERKIIMCTDIITLVRDKHKSLAPRAPTKSRPNSATNHTAKLGPRPSAAVKTTTKVKEADKSSPPQPLPLPLSKPSSAATSNVMTSLGPDPIQVQVVNEIRTTVASSLPTASITPENICPVSSNSLPCHTSNQDDSFNSIRPRSVTIDPTPVVMEIKNVEAALEPSIVPRVVREEKPSQHSIPSQHSLRQGGNVWNGMQAVVVTSGDQDTQHADVNSYNPARYHGCGEDEEDSEGDDASSTVHATVSHPRPIDMVAMTPARPAPAPPRAVPQRVTQTKTTSDITDHIMNDLGSSLASLEQSVQTLCTRMLGLESRLGVVEQLLSVQREREEEQQNARSDAMVTPEQLETLQARMTLVENKVAMVEAQQVSMNVGKLTKRTSTEPNTFHEQTNGQVVSDPLSDRVATPLQTPTLPLGLSPITTMPHTPVTAPTASPAIAGNGQATDSYDRRWSSTPNALGDEAPKSSTETTDENLTQAARIKQMLRATEDMLNIQVNSPIRPAAK